MRYEDLHGTSTTAVALSGTHDLGGRHNRDHANRSGEGCLVATAAHQGTHRRGIGQGTRLLLLLTSIILLQKTAVDTRGGLFEGTRDRRLVDAGFGVDLGEVQVCLEMAVGGREDRGIAAL